jgi:hypothetical protein
MSSYNNKITNKIYKNKQNFWWLRVHSNKNQRNKQPDVNGYSL